MLGDLAIIYFCLCAEVGEDNWCCVLCGTVGCVEAVELPRNEVTSENLKWSFYIYIIRLRLDVRPHVRLVLVATCVRSRLYDMYIRPCLACCLRLPTRARLLLHVCTYAPRRMGNCVASDAKDVQRGGQHAGLFLLVMTQAATSVLYN